MAIADVSVVHESPPSSRLTYLVAFVLGTALLLFGWFDARAYRSSANEPPLTYSLNTFPRGARVSPTVEFFRGSDGGYLRLENFWALEFSTRRSYRHGLGPVSTLEIFSERPAAQLRFRFVSDWPEQTLTVACNGQEVGRVAPVPEGIVACEYPLALHPGSNAVTFAYRHYNHDGICEAADDRRRAVRFLSLDLTLP